MLRHAENNAAPYLFPPSSPPLSKITDISQVHWTLKPSNHEPAVTNVLPLKTKLKVYNRIVIAFLKNQAAVDVLWLTERETLATS